MAWSGTKTPPGASPSPPPGSCRAPSVSPPAATANRGGSHQTAPCRPSPACAGPSPPPAGATPPAPPAPPAPTPPRSPHSPTPSGASRSAAADPCRRPPAGLSRRSWLPPGFLAHALLALEDAALDGAQRLELLAQRLLALVALLLRVLVVALGARALLCQPLHLAREALPLADVRREESGKAAGGRGSSCSGSGSVASNAARRARCDGAGSAAKSRCARASAAFCCATGARATSTASPITGSMPGCSCAGSSAHPASTAAAAARKRFIRPPPPSAGAPCAAG